jgi:hypothetical protein
VRIAGFLTIAVKINDSTNEPASRIIANIVNVSILIAPVNVFELFQKNRSSIAACNLDMYKPAAARSLYRKSMLLLRTFVCR